MLAVNLEVVSSTLLQDESVHQLIAPRQAPPRGPGEAMKAVCNSNGSLLRRVPALTVFKSRRSILRSLSLLFSRYHQSLRDRATAMSSGATPAAASPAPLAPGQSPRTLSRPGSTGFALAMPRRGGTVPVPPGRSADAGRGESNGSRRQSALSAAETANDRHTLRCLCSVTADVMGRLWDDSVCSPLLAAMSDEDTWDLLPPRLVWHTLAHLQQQLALCAPISHTRADSDTARDVSARGPLLLAWTAMLGSACRHVHRTGTVFGVASDGDLRSAHRRRRRHRRDGTPRNDALGAERMCDDPLAVLAENVDAALEALVAAHRSLAAASAGLRQVLQAGLEPDVPVAPAGTNQAVAGDHSPLVASGLHRVMSSGSMGRASAAPSTPLPPAALRQRDTLRVGAATAAAGRSGANRAATPRSPGSFSWSQAGGAGQVPSPRWGGNNGALQPRAMQPRTQQHFVDAIRACEATQAVVLQCLTRLVPACLTLVPASAVNKHVVSMLDVPLQQSTSATLQKHGSHGTPANGESPVLRAGASATPVQPPSSHANHDGSRSPTAATTATASQGGPRPRGRSSVPPSPASIRNAEAAGRRASLVSSRVATPSARANGSATRSPAGAANNAPGVAAPASVVPWPQSDAAASTLAHLLRAARDPDADTVSPSEQTVRDALLPVALRYLQKLLGDVVVQLNASIAAQGAGDASGVADDVSEGGSVATGFTGVTSGATSIAASVASASRASNQAALVVLEPGTEALLRALLEYYLPRTRAATGGAGPSPQALAVFDLLPVLLQVVCAAARVPHCVAIGAAVAGYAAQLIAAVVGEDTPTPSTSVDGADGGGNVLAGMVSRWPWQKLERLCQLLLASWQPLNTALITLHRHANPLRGEPLVDPFHTPTRGQGVGGRGWEGPSDPTVRPTPQSDQWMGVATVRALRLAGGSSLSLKDGLLCVQRCVHTVLRGCQQHGRATATAAGASSGASGAGAGVGAGAANRDGVPALMQSAFDVLVQIIQRRDFSEALRTPSPGGTRSEASARCRAYEAALWGLLLVVLKWNRNLALRLRQGPGASPSFCDVPALCGVLLRLVWIRCEHAHGEADAAGESPWVPDADEHWMQKAAVALFIVFCMEHDQVLRFARDPFGDRGESAAAFVTRPPASLLETEMLRTFLAWIVASLYREEAEVPAPGAARVVWRNRRAIDRLLAFTSAFQQRLLEATSGGSDPAVAAGVCAAGADADADANVLPLGAEAGRFVGTSQGHRDRVPRSQAPGAVIGLPLSAFCNHLRQRLLQFRHYVAVLRQAPVYVDQTPCCLNLMHPAHVLCLGAPARVVVVVFVFVVATVAADWVRHRQQQRRLAWSTRAMRMRWTVTRTRSMSWLLLIPTPAPKRCVH